MDIRQTVLSEVEVEFISVSERDEIGKVFSYDNKILRAIYKHKVDYVNQLLASGLIDELVSKGMFPKTTVSDYVLDGFGMVLEHEKIQPVVMPPQWSFDMLKDAALLVIELNQIARKYGYQTMDCHGYNVIFRKNKPVYVDLGSFIINPPGFKGWFAYEGFRQFYLYPLIIAQTGNWYWARLVMMQPTPMPHYAYYYLRHPLSKIFKNHRIEFYFHNFFKFKLLSYFSDAEIEKKIPLPLRKIISPLKKMKLLPFQNTNLNRLKTTINNLTINNISTEWGDYHNQLKGPDGFIKSTSRFDRIVEITKELSIETALELGGNQGVFSQILVEKAKVKTIICTDYDEAAVNIMYNMLKKTEYDIAPALLNFVMPFENKIGRSVYSRFKSDAVFALALSHHLLLTQKMPIKVLFEELIKYSKKYVFVEFMPLGLYNPKSKNKYIVPDWYSIEYFRDNFMLYFTVLYEEKIDTNRVIFVGEIKA